MVGVFKTHENRQIAVNTRGIQRRGVFYHELRVKGLDCVNSWGSFSQVRTPARRPIVGLSGKWRTRRTKATIAICPGQNIKVSSKDRLCLKTAILLQEQ